MLGVFQNMDSFFERFSSYFFFLHDDSSLNHAFLILLTLSVFLLSSKCQRMLSDKKYIEPLLHPIVVSVIVIGLLLKLMSIDYQQYFEANQAIHFLLGPATVALAIPLYYQLSILKRHYAAILLSLFAGSVAAAVGGVFIAFHLGAAMDVMLSLAPKSVTAPVALGIAEKLGGNSALTVALVVVTGMSGLVLGPLMFTLLNVKDDICKGIAMGIISHGMGVAYAYQKSKKMGVYAGLAMVLSAMVTATVLPFVFAWLQ